MPMERWQGCCSMARRQPTLTRGQKMKHSKISQTILTSAAVLSAGLLSGTPVFAQESAASDSSSQQDTYANFEQFRGAVLELREKVAQDPDFRARYLAKPTEVLSETGLPANLQMEMMREDGLAYGPAFKTLDCICTQTCLKTN